MIYLANTSQPTPKPTVGTAAKIASFERLPPGWNYGRGTAASHAAVAHAMTFLALFYREGLTRTDGFPGPNGEIAITAYHGDHYLNVEVDSTEEAVVCYEKDGVELIWKEGVRLEEAKALVSDVARKITQPCATHGSSTSGGMIVNVQSFTTLRLRTTQSTNAPLSSTWNAPQRQAVLYAITSPSIIRSQGSPLPSGNLMYQQYRLPVTGQLSKKIQSPETLVITT